MKSHRETLINTFVNAVYLYDEKVLITFNYKDGTKTITFDEIAAKDAPEGNGSDLGCFAPPRTPVSNGYRSFCFICLEKGDARVDSNSCGAVAEDSAKTAQWAVFSSAARDVHPRPPRTPVSNGYRSFCFICLAKGTARVDSNSIDLPNSPAGKKAPVQQRRPLPAAETGRSCWGCGQQDARAAQGTVQPLGAATRAPYTARLATSALTHIASVSDL